MAAARSPYYALSVATGAAVLLLTLPLPNGDLQQRWPALMAALENSAHAPMFAVLSALLYRALRRQTQLKSTAVALLAFAGCTAFAGTTEYVQALVGRDASWVDLVSDLLGTLTGVLWRSSDRLKTGLFRLPRQVANGLAMVPLLASFWPLTATSLAYLHRSTMSPVIWRASDTSLHRFSKYQAGDYPGLLLSEVPEDWCGHSALQIDVQNTATTVITVTVRAHDALHDYSYADRFNRDFPLEPGEQQTLSIPLEDLLAAPAHRPMDLRHMRGIGIFQGTSNGHAGFRTREIRLVPAPFSKCLAAGDQERPRPTP